VFVLFGITTALLIVCGAELTSVIQALDALSDSSTARSLSDSCSIKNADGRIVGTPKPCLAVTTTISIALLVLPLSLLRDQSSLRFTSTLSVTSVLFVIVVMVVKGGLEMHRLGSRYMSDHTSDVLFGPPNASSTAVLTAIPIITLAFSCQFNLPVGRQRNL
jgi:amino acid permease